MAETMQEGGSAPRSSGGNPLTRKIGALPMWAWLAIFTAVVVVYAYVKKSKTSNSNSAAAGGVNSPGGVDASLVPQFVNQTYVQNAPPTSTTTTTPTIPKTISGSPGSYTTGLPGGMNEWTSNGKYSLTTIAKSHGMTAQQLIAASEASQNNPNLAAYVKKGNLNAPLPSGVEVFIPNSNWGIKK